MAICIRKIFDGEGKGYAGLSTDDKRDINAAINDEFEELDTGDTYFLESAGTWKKKGYNASAGE